MAECFDFVVVGAGVVGCALLERLQTIYPKSSCCLLEKENFILSGASGGNSGILHTGFDAPLDSVESFCMVRGYKLIHQLYNSFRSEKPFQLSKSGAIMVSWSEDDDDYLQQVASMIPEEVPYEFWNTEKVYQHEKNLTRTPLARGALYIPEESVIDPYAFPLLLLRLAVQKSASVQFNTELLSSKLETMANDTQEWRLTVKSNGQRDVISSRVLINCAGNFGDIVEQRIFNKDPLFHITPRKGQFIVYEKASGDYLSSTVLPIPTPRTKGVLVCKSIFGNVIVGPTAEDQTERMVATTDGKTGEFLKAKGESILPALKNFKIQGMYAGLRPASEYRDYRIRFDEATQYICVGGIRSTGLTACMGIAEYVCSSLQQWAICNKYTYTPYKIPVKQKAESVTYQNTPTGLMFHSEAMKNLVPVTHCLPNSALLNVQSNL